MSEDTLQDELNIYRDSFEEKHLQEYLERVAEILDISHPKFCIKFGTKKGDNYMAIIYRVFIGGEKNGIPVKVSTILKAPPQDEISRSRMQVDHLFPREHTFYLEKVPIFKELLSMHNKSLENIPKCYFSSSVSHREGIYLEDLQPLGFVMRDRIKPLDFVHMSLAFRALGRFHALSFALREQKPELFASEVMTLTEPLFRQDLINGASFIEHFRKRGHLVKMALAEESARYAERLTEFADKFLHHIELSYAGNLAEPYAVLAHGDFWANNLLFKYKEDSMEPTDLYFLDFQMARYASPATDIWRILYISCSQQLRGKHFDKLITIYHESLSAYLSELGSDPKKLFPYDALLDQLKQFSKVAALSVTSLLPGMTSQDEDVLNNPSGIHDITVLEARLQRNQFWRNTLRDAFKDLIDRNYI